MAILLLVRTDDAGGGVVGGGHRGDCFGGGVDGALQ